MITIGEIYSVIRFITRSGTFITYVLSGTSALSLKKAIRDVDEDIYGILLSRKTYLQKICVKWNEIKNTHAHHQSGEKPEHRKSGRRKTGARKPIVGENLWFSWLFACFPRLSWAYSDFWLFLRPIHRCSVGVKRISLKNKKSRHCGGFNPPLLKGGYNVQSNSV